jgi:hypothetical protein
VTDSLPQIALEPDLWRWLIGQSVALTVAVLWILSLLRADTRSRKRIDELSDYLVHSTESALAERLRQSEAHTQNLEKAALERSKLSEQHSLQLDSTQRAVTESFTRVLEKALASPDR